MPQTPAKSADREAIMRSLYPEIRAEMVRRGETVASAAEHFCLDRTNINRKLNGSALLSVIDLLGFADWLDVPADELLRRAAATATTKRSTRGGRAA